MSDLFLSIEIQPGIHIKIDALDAELVQGKTWYLRPKGYVSSYVRKDGVKKLFYLHRFLMKHWGLLEDKQMVDHINGDRLDNRRSNLRACDASENAMNRGPKVKGSSQYKGVCYMAKYKVRSWQAKISVNGNSQVLGMYLTEDEAAKAYDAAALILHGEFARLNFPELTPATELF